MSIMNKIHEILEICLKEIEAGADVDSVLFRYPEYAEELRPLLETSVKAKALAVPDPSRDVMRRNRARLLQHAAQLREANATPARRIWLVPLRRAMVTLSVIAALLVSTNGLVHAASTTLPGDSLYPVKRTWEDVRILLTFNVNVRATLEVEHENERLYELEEVFAKGRSVPVDFAGLVTRQNGDLWLVSGIPVALSSQTDLPDQSIVIGDAVRIVGTTQNDGAVLAETIELLPAGMPLPNINDDDSFELETEHSGDSDSASDDNSGKGSEGESPTVEVTRTPHPESGSDSNSGPESELRDVSVEGTVESVNGNIVVINNQIMNIGSAEVKGQPQAGASAKVEGYYDANGLFIVTRIEFQNVESGSGGGSTSTDNTTDDHSTDDNSGGGGSDSGDDHGGGSNSGSGGGGDG